MDSYARIILKRTCENENCDGQVQISFSEPTKDMNTQWNCERCGRKHIVAFKATDFKIEYLKQLKQQVQDLEQEIGH